MFKYIVAERTSDKNRFVESDIEECLKARTEQLSQFRDLGAPDLVHYRRVSGSREVHLIYNCAYRRWEHIITLQG